MKVLLFGATGMIGRAALRECLLSSDVERVLAVGRQAPAAEHPKLATLAHRDFSDFSAVAAQFKDYDACLFCLGVSAAGLSEAEYTRVTFDYTLAAARAFESRARAQTFVYISATGADSSERGRVMWARVKGRTENALFAMPFAAAYMFRPGYIQPLHGIVSRTRLYRMLYAVGSPLYPLLQKLAPSAVTDTERLGRALVRAAREGAEERLLENRDINALAARPERSR